jgi:selenide,water dikinase
MPQAVLRRCLRDVPLVRDERLLVGTETFDDAGVYRLDASTALVQTVDLFTPIVDDPYWFGAIAAANSLSDVYAMGGRPITCLSVAGFPADLDPEVFTAILTGSAEKVREAGAVVAGGHTIIDNELKYGLSVTGIVHPDQIVRNTGAKPGDRLVLTKRLGTGFISTGIKKEIVPPDLVDEVTAAMAELNRGAGEAMTEVGVSAATDVTGFGLFGHALEMARSSDVTLRFSYGAIPVYPWAVENYKSCLCGGTGHNRQNCLPEIDFRIDLTEGEQFILFDAQTSGGLFVSVPGDRLDRFLDALEARGVGVRAVVGEVRPRGSHPIEVVA